MTDIELEGRHRGERERVRAVAALAMVGGAVMLRYGYLAGVEGIPFLAVGGVLFVVAIFALRWPQLVWYTRPPVAEVEVEAARADRTVEG